MRRGFTLVRSILQLHSRYNCCFLGKILVFIRSILQKNANQWIVVVIIHFIRMLLDIVEAKYLYPMEEICSYELENIIV